jgi:hypothetical protein
VRRVAAVVVLFISTFFGVPASAAPPPARPPVIAGPGDPLCSVEEWRTRGLDECISRLHDVSAARAQCLHAPEPAAPDSGFGGWFASKPTWDTRSGIGQKYSTYGYAGYDYTTYDIGCADTLMHPDYKLESTIANGEFMIATGIVAASNGLREKAWDPGQLWSWSDPLVDKATKAIYARVFSVFGVVTLAVVGLYLLWRSRQAHMSSALTTAGWAILVLIAVTALAAWPVKAANIADTALVGTLSVVHDAIGPNTNPSGPCSLPDPNACKDNRPPAVRAGDTAVDNLLYRNWLRGSLGSADSPTAQKYGPALYRAKSFSWQDIEAIQSNPARRQGIIDAKKRDWMKVGEQIRAEDPDAYEYLRGTKSMERVGAGFVAILAAIAYASFDIVASLLVLLGFLIIRWAVVAAPALGTVGILRPASAGLRRLVNAVIAAIINVAIFGTAAAVYLFAVDLIMSTASLPGWLQVTLVLLCGVVGWMLLRPHARITQLSGRSSGAAALLMARPAATTTTTTTTNVDVTHDGKRNEAHTEVEVTQEVERIRRAEALPSADPRRRAWVTADVPESDPDYVIYRPASVPHQVGPQTIGSSSPTSQARTEARAETR